MRVIDQRKSSVRRRWIISILAVYTLVSAVLYFPIITANFQGDDFGFLRYLFFNFSGLMEGRGLKEWLTSFPWLSFLPYFRPGLQLFNLLDYTAWGLNPIGYHLTNIALHISTAFFVFVMGWQLTRARVASVAAGLFFGIMPIHVEAVSWFAARADGLSTLWYLMSVVFFVFFRQRRRNVFLLISVIAFTLAILVKETAATLPIIILVYDWLYNLRASKDRKRLFAPHLWLWLILLIYIGLRVVIGLPSGAYLQSRLLELNWDYFSQVYVLGMVDPMLSDMTSEIRWVLLAIALAALWLYRQRREVWFGAAWAGLTVAPVLLGINDALFDRYLYLPTIGLALMLGSILANLGIGYGRLTRIMEISLVLGLAIFYGTALYARNAEWGRAAQITQIVEEQVKAAHPVLPADARLVFVNVPVLVGGRQMQAFGNMLPSAMQILYRNPDLQVFKASNFPVLTDDLDKTYFFEYNRRTLIERADLVGLLTERNRCNHGTIPALTWDFAKDAQGWEPWNQLDGFQNRDGMLITQSQGNDPYMASPEFDIPALAAGDVEITMRVTANQPKMEGAVYWRLSSHPDFEPGMFKSITVYSDGELHTYHVDLASSGQLFIGDSILRLRFDPVDAPVQIAIQTIRVNVLCASMQGEHCVCAP